MSGKIIARLLWAAGTVVGKALVEAYGQAMLNAAKGAAQNATQQALHGAASRVTSGPVSRAIQQSGMTPEEASKILHLELKKVTKEDLQQRFDTMFKANDPANKGSLYLQSKIYRAKECLDLEMQAVADARAKNKAT